jgi:hypothetical protein
MAVPSSHHRVPSELLQSPVLVFWSPQAGFHFLDGQAVVMYANVTGALGTAAVSWTLQDPFHTWVAYSGTLQVPTVSGNGSAALPLAGITGLRSLYTLTASATASGATSVTVSTRVAVTYTPPAPSPTSQFGIFALPVFNDAVTGRMLGNVYAQQSRSVRNLGASWLRFNFQGTDYTTTLVPPAAVVVDPTYWKQRAQAYSADGIHIMGSFGSVPGVISKYAPRTCGAPVRSADLLYALCILG